MKTAFRQIEITPCKRRLESEARGLFGFHDSVDCPDCIKTERGFSVHLGSSIAAPWCGHHPDAETYVSPFPVYFTR